jgi:hypothetical protein
MAWSAIARPIRESGICQFKMRNATKSRTEAAILGKPHTLALDIPSGKRDFLHMLKKFFNLSFQTVHNEATGRIAMRLRKLTCQII